jgi:hypothetical protein
MREVRYSKLVFLDSTDGLKGSKTLAPTFHVPMNAFSCGNDESIRLVLKNFTLARGCFYGINQTNNTFLYRRTANNTETPITIPPGDYTGQTLASAISSAVNSAMSSSTFACVYNATTRLFTMTIPTSFPSGYFVSYFDKTRTHPHGSDGSLYYSDVHEVLGGVSSVLSEPVNMFNGNAHTQNAGTTQVQSKYPIRLRTMDSVYLRCSAQGDAFCSSSFDHVRSGNKLENCDLWASVPVSSSAGDDLIVLQDNSDDYQIHIKEKQVSTLKFALSDGKGRELPLVADDQASAGNLRFRIAFKFEVMSEQHEAYIVKGASQEYRHPPTLTK